MTFPLDLFGIQFDRLKVVARAGSNSRGDAMWSCECKCGGTVIVRRWSLVSGTTKSCGCLHIETAISTGRNNKTHGYSGTPEYDAWKTMMSRCYSKKNKKYPNYGGRGIRVCDRWHVVENFLRDMGARPSSDLSIDRRDNDGHYEPLNCHWATEMQQVRNRRVTVMNVNLARDLKDAKARGERVSHWARTHGINIGTAFAVTRGITWKEA